MAGVQLKQLHAQLNPFGLRREIERRLKEMNAIRQVSAGAGPAFILE